MSQFLSELELDALTELVNIGVSHAASSLRELVSEQVLLSVPTITLVSRQCAIELLAEREPRKLIAVHQNFEGDIAGQALLMFPDSKSLELVRAVTGGDLPLEDIVDLEAEALAEIGNIILNGCLATIANMLKRSLRTSLPEIVRGQGTAFFESALPAEPRAMAMLLYVDFAVRSRDIRGYIALLMDMPTMAALKQLLGEVIQRTAIDVPRPPKPRGR
jgi:chemotaxis protein CheC